MEANELISTVQSLEPAATLRDKVDRPAMSVPKESVPALMRRLRDEPALSFDMLCAHTAIDWHNENRIELVYQLYSTKHRHYLAVFVSLLRDMPVVTSVSDVWRIAEWQEREVYDMFGVLYRSHPDLRRILLDDDWKGFPLRKDYKDEFMLEAPK
ncbi:MAG: NADH-quinone oxidoreductase subunit C [Oligoflexia bacterium]|nr:NADH-quinone oxidoreductase subunit C [Oligoflexia bacterium]